MNDQVSLQDHIERLVRKYGSLREVAKRVRLDHAYLYRLKIGEKTMPSTCALKRLGLERQSHYRIVKEV